MSATTVLAVGDKFECSVLVSGADWCYGNSVTELGRYYLSGTTHGRECDPDGAYSCPMCFDQWEWRAFTVVSVDYCVDS